MIITTASTLRSLGPDLIQTINRIPNGLLKAIAHPRYCVLNAVAAPPKRLFYNKAGLGANNHLTDRHFVKYSLSSDSLSPITRLTNCNDADHQEKLDEYKKAFQMVNGRKPTPMELLVKRPWEALSFSDRGVLEKSNVPYVDYYRNAVNTAIEREGQVHFYLGGMSIENYVQSIVKTEDREGKPFEDFAATVDYRTLANVGRGVSFSSGYFIEYPEDIVEQPSITNVELYDATMGAFKETGKTFKYYAKNDVLLETDKLLEMQAALLKEARSKSNVELVLSGQDMSPDVKLLVGKLQRYIDEGR